MNDKHIHTFTIFESFLTGKINKNKKLMLINISFRRIYHKILSYVIQAQCALIHVEFKIIKNSANFFILFSNEFIH